MGGLIWPNLRIINGLSRDMADGFMAQVNPGGALVMNDPDYAVKLAREGRTVIYRQSGDDGQDNPFQYTGKQFMAKRMHPQFYEFKDKIVLGTTNEIDPSVQVDQFNMACSDAAHEEGFCVALYNHSSNKSSEQWEIHRKTLEVCIPRGDWPCFHLYDDLQHRDGALGWINLYNDLGGQWACTEIEYIRNLTDAYKGPRGAPKPEDQPDDWHDRMWRYWCAVLARYDIILCAYSLDIWPADDAGKRDGFGYNDDESVRATFTRLNSLYIFKGVIVPQIEKPTTPITSILINSIPNATWRNIRPQPAYSGQDIGDLHVGDTVNAFLDSPQQGATGSTTTGTWIYIMSPESEGWVWWDGIVYQKKTPADGALLSITNADLNTLKGVSASLARQIELLQTDKDQIDAVIKGVAPITSGGGF